jgi:hypothetical protein
VVFGQIFDVTEAVKIALLLVARKVDGPCGVEPKNGSSGVPVMRSTPHRWRCIRSGSSPSHMGPIRPVNFGAP